jgi:hypothetical protein
MLLNQNLTNDFIIDQDGAVYTQARRVEVVFLRILTEMEAPLWAFKEITDWACDAYQSGYKFMPK